MEKPSATPKTNKSSRKPKKTGEHQSQYQTIRENIKTQVLNVSENNEIWKNKVQPQKPKKLDENNKS